MGKHSRNSPLKISFCGGSVKAKNHCKKLQQAAASATAAEWTNFPSFCFEFAYFYNLFGSYRLACVDKNTISVI